MINFSIKPKINRYASFTFDDGFINSANKINQLIHPNKATFYIVTGWVKPNSAEIKDSYNIGVDHGNFEQWKKLSDTGHEIGSHTISHLRPDESKITEYFDSLNYIKQFHDGPYSLAMPYGLEPLISLPYDSIRLCIGKKIYNPLKKINLLELISFDPVESNLPITKTLKKISRLPSNSWLIIRAHGLDDEGYCPWPSEYLKKIYKFLLKENFEIKTVREMTQKLN